MKLTITTGTEKDFFERGKKIARKLDQGESVEPECVISFEDPQELLELVTNLPKPDFSTLNQNL